MLAMNGRFLKLFVHILKLEVDGLNWVIFEDHFAFVAAATGLKKHIDSTEIAPNPLTFTSNGPSLLTAEQITELELYEEKQSRWLMDEAAIR